MNQANDDSSELNNSKDTVDLEKSADGFDSLDVFTEYARTRARVAGAETSEPEADETRANATPLKTAFKESAIRARQLAKALNLPIDLKRIPNKFLTRELGETIERFETAREKSPVAARAREIFLNGDLEFAEFEEEATEKYADYGLNLKGFSNDYLREKLNDELDSLEAYAKRLADEIDETREREADAAERTRDMADESGFRLEMNGAREETLTSPPKANEPVPTAPSFEVKTIVGEDKTMKITLAKGLKHGPMSISDGKGNLEMELEFFMNELHGSSKYYFPNGRLERQIEFKNGKMDGTMRVFDEEGKPSMEIDYKDGLTHGQSVTYNERGEVHIRASHANGKQDGETIIYSNGIPYLRRVYKDGIELSQEIDKKALKQMG